MASTLYHDGDTDTGLTFGTDTINLHTGNVNRIVINNTSVRIPGNLVVDGVLTYDDVKNVDSIGIVTARNGINVTGGNINVGTGVTIESNGNATFAGIITSSSDIDLISNDAQLLLEYPGRTRAHITANYYNLSLIHI